MEVQVRARWHFPCSTPSGMQRPSTNFGATPRSTLRFEVPLTARSHTNMSDGIAEPPPMLRGKCLEQPSLHKIQVQARRQISIHNQQRDQCLVYAKYGPCDDLSSPLHDHQQEPKQQRPKLYHCGIEALLVVQDSVERKIPGTASRKRRTSVRPRSSCSRGPGPTR